MYKPVRRSESKQPEKCLGCAAADTRSFQTVLPSSLYSSRESRTALAYPLQEPRASLRPQLPAPLSEPSCSILSCQPRTNAKAGAASPWLLAIVRTHETEIYNTLSGIDCCCNQALAQACAVCSPKSGSMSAMGILRQLWMLRAVGWHGDAGSIHRFRFQTNRKPLQHANVLEHPLENRETVECISQFAMLLRVCDRQSP